MVCQADESSPMPTQKSVTWPQWLGGIGGMLLTLQLGIMAGWTSPYLAQLTAEDSVIPITLTEASWVVSLFNLGRLFGAIVGSISVNYLGSKTTILITSSPMALGWICTIVANHVIWLYTCRFLGGVGLGMTYSCLPIYLGEIAAPNIRGALVALSMSGLTVGTLVISCMGAYLPMEISGAVSLSLCLILMALFIWLPESPHHLVKKNLDEKATFAISWYNRGCDANEELRILKKFVQNFSSESFIDTIKEFRSPSIKKALIISTLLFVYSQLSGLNSILFYMEIILRSVKVNVVAPSTVVMIVMVFGIVASGLSMILIERFGRRLLMLLTVFTVIISLICLATTFQVVHSGYDASSIQTLPIFSVILFQVSMYAGVLPVPSAVLSEIFPPHVKCIAACFGSITAGLSAFVSSITYQPLVDAFNEEITFFSYAVILLSSIPIILLYVPETKGKTLQEIQDELVKKS